MERFLAGRGVVVRIGEGARSSAYQLKNAGGLENLFNKADSKNGIALITNVDVQDKDIALTVVCTDDFRALYSFGRDFGRASIHGTAFFGGKGTGSCDSSEAVLKELVDGFQSVRLSKKQDPCELSIANAGAWKLYPVALELKDANGAMNSLNFTIDAIIGC